MAHYMSSARELIDLDNFSVGCRSIWHIFFSELYHKCVIIKIYRVFLKLSYFIFLTRHIEHQKEKDISTLFKNDYFAKTIWYISSLLYQVPRSFLFYHIYLIFLRSFCCSTVPLRLTKKYLPVPHYVPTEETQIPVLNLSMAYSNSWSTPSIRCTMVSMVTNIPTVIKKNKLKVLTYLKLHFYF